MDETDINILHIASGDLWAGGEVQLYNLTCGLNKLPNTTVSVILLNHGTLEQELTKAGIKVTVFDENTLSALGILRKFIQFIHEQRPDIVHTQRAKVNIFGSLAAFVCGRIPSLRTAHGSQEYPPSWTQFNMRLILLAERFCDKMLQRKIIAVSKDLGEIFTKEFPPDKITTIENGIDSALLIDNLGPETDTARDNSNRVFRVAIAGRLVTIKRIDLFIKTAHYFKRHYPDTSIQFYVFGDGPLRKELEALNSELETGDMVHFEGHCDNLPKQLKMIDALLMTSDHEGLPMALLEAMTLKAPIIAHAVGGIPNLLDQGRCGILVEDHTGAGYAQAVYELLNDPTKKQALIQNALDRVRNVYSAEKNAQAHLQLYRQMLSH